MRTITNNSVNANNVNTLIKSILIKNYFDYLQFQQIPFPLPLLKVQFPQADAAQMAHWRKHERRHAEAKQTLQAPNSDLGRSRETQHETQDVDNVEDDVEGALIRDSKFPFFLFAASKSFFSVS